MHCTNVLSWVPSKETMESKLERQQRPLLPSRSMSPLPHLLTACLPRCNPLDYEWERYRSIQEIHGLYFHTLSVVLYWLIVHGPPWSNWYERWWGHNREEVKWPCWEPSLARCDDAIAIFVFGWHEQVEVVGTNLVYNFYQWVPPRNSGIVG